MKEKLRRPLLFLITVGTGSLFIIIDASVDVIIAGTMLAGFFALIITGTLKIADLKPSRLRAALRERPEMKEEKPDPSLIRRFATSEIDLGSMFGTLATSVREVITHARTPEGEKKRAIEEIDTMLDQAVDDPATAKTPADVVDPLAALADLDLDSLDSLDLDEDADPESVFGSDRISSLSGEEAGAVSEILRAHQSELEEHGLPDGSGLAADLLELPDMSALSAELSTLDDLDFDEIEIEGEEFDDEGMEDEEFDDEETGGDESARDGEDLEEAIEQPVEVFDMVSFASGGVVDNDLIASLKSDVKKKKFVEDMSLVRELRGEKYNAQDLANELEEILAMLKPK